MRVLVTGAHSYIGTSFRAYALHRRPDWQVQAISLRGEAWRQTSFSGYDAVVHAAGLAHADTGANSPQQERRYRQINADLAAAAAEKARREGVGQFVFLSSSAVYGGSAPVGKETLITADTSPNPASCYGRSKLLGEAAVRSLNAPGFAAAVLRLPTVYGPGCRGNYPKLSKLARRAPLFPFVENRRSMLYVENLCEFLVFIIENRESGIFHPQNREYVCTSRLVQEIAALHGRRLLMLRGLTPLLRLAGGAGGVVNKVFGSLAYAPELSRYPQPYQLYSLEESIRRTEQK